MDDSRVLHPVYYDADEYGPILYMRNRMDDVWRSCIENVDGSLEGKTVRIITPH